MSAPGEFISDAKAQERTRAFLGNSIAVLDPLVIDYPLVSRRWGTMLLGWMMIAVGLLQFIFARHFLWTGSPVT